VIVEIEGKAAPRTRRRGRPTASDGLTEQRILEAARICFAKSGYAGTSTHAVAARADLTTGALYHYFNSKRHLYAAVFHEVEEMVYARLRGAAAKKSTFPDRIGATFDELLRLNQSDSTMARFLRSVTTDVARHPDLQEVFKTTSARRDEFFQTLVDLAVVNGELAVADRQMVIETVTTMTVGLGGVSDLVPGAQVRAVEGYNRLFNGMLLQKGSCSK
jgi:AcrR family transcriptional regulator